MLHTIKYRYTQLSIDVPDQLIWKTAADGVKVLADHGLRLIVGDLISVYDEDADTFRQHMVLGDDATCRHMGWGAIKRIHPSMTGEAMRLHEVDQLTLGGHQVSEADWRRSRAI